MFILLKTKNFSSGEESRRGKRKFLGSLPVTIFENPSTNQKDETNMPDNSKSTIGGEILHSNLWYRLPRNLCTCS